MTKSQARWLFDRSFAHLTLFAESKNIRFLTYSFFRTREEQERMVKTGKSKTMNSAHRLWLARDIVIITDTEEAIWAHKKGDGYDQMGTFWLGLHPACEWGGTFGREEGKLGWDPYHFGINPNTFSNYPFKV